jgi:hypothetical protein
LTPRAPAQRVLRLTDQSPARPVAASAQNKPFYSFHPVHSHNITLHKEPS